MTSPRMIAVWGEAFPIPVPADGADHQLINTECKMIGWSLRETTGAAAAVAQLFSGGGTGGVQAAEIPFATGDGQPFGIPDGGLVCNGGLFLHMVSGTIRGAVWVRVRERVEE